MAASLLTIRRVKIVGAATAACLLVLIVLALLLLSFGWDLLRPVAERRASAVLGRTVSITRIRRVGGGLLHPLLAIEGVRIAQPNWAGRGDMVRLQSARVRIAALPLLTGKFEPQSTLIDGLRVALFRSVNGQANWEPAQHQSTAQRGPTLGRLNVRNAEVTVDDREHQHRFDARLLIDGRGLRLTGTGSVGGAPATIAMIGAPVQGSAAWPFRAEVASDAVTLRAAGRMRAPLDLGHFTARVESRGRNLIDLDHLIEAGLPVSQPFQMSATIEHDQPSWIVTHLLGRIGRSDLAGAITVRKRGGRVLLDGHLRAAQFDFDDLATDAQLAHASALARRIGPRVIPPTRIRLDMLHNTDGTLRVQIGHLLSRSPTIFRSLQTTLTLDHSVLTAAPIVAGLNAGTLTGTASIRHPSGTPVLSLDLTIANSRVERVVRTEGIVSGPLAGRIELQGMGSTVREAVGKADGRIALAVSGGTVTRRVALFLGADVGRGLFAGNTDRTAIRCIVGNFVARRGIARPDPLIFDTSVARADGSGTINLADETIALDFHGMPKKEGALRLNGPITARGTLDLPAFNPPPQTRTLGGILKMVGKALGGERLPLGRDADCGALETKALR